MAPVFAHGIERISLCGICLFFILLIFSLLPEGNTSFPTVTAKKEGRSASHSLTKLFFSEHGKSHRMAGFLQLCWLVAGAIRLLLSFPDDSYPYWDLAYDVMMGWLGIRSTLTAAHDFPHKHILNSPGQSGTLEQSAFVTQSEMREHVFYQGLNLIQALYLHALTWGLPRALAVDLSTMHRLVLVFLVTSPWWIRHRFPVHSFSANWKTPKGNEEKQKSLHPHRAEASQDEDPERRIKEKASAPRVQEGSEVSSPKPRIEIRLYQIKKWQYVFYKHVVLHGINISVAFPTGSIAAPLALSTSWKLFWLALNTSYVMEFFLQSLVKRHILSQRRMILLQNILMASSTLAAVVAVAPVVRPWVSLLSVLLNFVHRYHDVQNTFLVAVLAAALRNSEFKSFSHLQPR